MPNAKTFPIPSSNNQNYANPSERLSELSRMIDEECIRESRRLREYYENRFREDPNCQGDQIAEIIIRFGEDLANRQNRQDPNPNDELLRFSEDDIDSNIDSDIDSDDECPGLTDENVMTFDD